MAYSKDNSICVKVSQDNPHPDTDPNKVFNFMHVFSPEHVSIVITKTGDIYINVNSSCVFILENPGQLAIEDNCERNC